jgi:hypothetical protein
MFTVDADIFFEEPHSGRHSPGQFGVLYLLRRDIFRCMGIDPITRNPMNYMALWPGTMAILAGIDLLGKFFAGRDQRGGVGKRFCDYLKEYFQPISTGDGGVIYQLRNALLHSFGLYSEDKGKIYEFVLVQNQSQLIQQVPADTYIVDIRELHRRFEESVCRYKVQLENDKNDLQKNFTAMFPKYGAIRIE